ncbi:MAG: hypothetical protein V4608_13580 [Bacteroidota bacterium]
MKKGFLKLVLVISGFAIVNTLSAQITDTVANVCAKHFEDKFISDGQQYRALLMNADETAEFHVTLYGGTLYRIAACSGLKDGDLVISIYDTAPERNLLYSNKDYKNAPFWDFKINSTLDCVIEAKLDSEGSRSSGRAVVLIGFKQIK